MEPRFWTVFCRATLAGAQAISSWHAVVVTRNGVVTICKRYKENFILVAYIYRKMSTSNGDEVIQQLKRNAIDWVELDKAEQKAKQTLKEVSVRKKELSSAILTGLEAVDTSEIHLQSGGKLKCSTTTTYAPLKKEDVFEKLRTELQDDSRAQQITDKLYDKDSRSKKETVTLKRTAR